MRIGHIRANYPEKRLIIGKISSAHYIEIADPSKILSHRVAQINKIVRKNVFSPFDAGNIHISLKTAPADCIHLINSVCIGPTPWVTTFETISPRFISTLRHASCNPDYTDCKDKLGVRLAVRSFAHKSCLSIIALSQCAERIQLEFLGKFDRLGDLAIPKLTTIHPPQPLHDRDLPISRDSNRRVRLMLVGGAFFRKGDREILAALSSLRESGLGRLFHLTIVSSLRIDPYASGETCQDVKLAESFIRSNSDWIEWHQNLPNSEVIECMKRCDVGLLPTYADTYGYSVLEFQSCGCPVITTNIRALPEINPEDCGWQIKVPTNRFGEALYQTSAERNALSYKITSGLVEILTSIAQNPESIRPKAIASLHRIKSFHDPRQYAFRLNEVYRNING